MGLQDPQRLAAFFNGSVFMGFDVSTRVVLRRRSTAARRGNYADSRLSAVSGCSPSVGAVNARLHGAVERMGSVNGQQSWLDLVGVCEAIEGALANPTRTTKPPSPPAGALRAWETKCAVPCKGAVTMVGVVSGSPECLACLERFCKR